MPKPSIVDHIRALLRKVRGRRRNHGRQASADRFDQALKDLQKPVKKPAPPTPPAAHGFMPGALNKNIPPGSNDPAITPAGVIYHVAVSTADSLHDFFEHDGGIESHFYVRFDGTIEQYRSIFFEADAQFAGNSFGSPRKGFISIETAGMGDGTWTTAQLDSLKRITLWVRSQATFPLRVCPTWDGPGVGYHALFASWNTDHHSCPGPKRIAQFHDVIVPWLKAGAPKP